MKVEIVEHANRITTVTCEIGKKTFNRMHVEINANTGRYLFISYILREFLNMQLCRNKVRIVGAVHELILLE